MPAGHRSTRARFAPQTLYAQTYGKLHLAWQRLARGRRVGATTSLLERTQWLWPEEVAQAQVVELRRLLAHAGAHVPYYRELFARVRFDPRAVESVADLEALPLLTRETVRERYDELVSPAHRSKNIRKATSGTSGNPLRFEYCNESEAWRQATRLRGYAWAGYRPGLPTLHYWGTTVHVPSGLKGAKRRLDRALRREAYYDAARQDDASLQRFADAVARVHPHAIVGYSQALALFARWAVEHGKRRWGDVRVICGAEATLPQDRAALVRAFGPHVFETYGARETMLIAAECETHEGMHLCEENLVVEITRQGRAVPAGDTGDVVITDLHNYGMPFIRYVNGDVAAFEPRTRCECGRALRRLERVDGRRSDTLRDRHGAPVPGIVFLSHMVFEEELVRQFQVVQKRSGEIEFKIVRGRDWSDSKFAPAEKRIASYFEGLPFRVIHVTEIAPDASGKRRPVVVERVNDLPTPS